MNRDYYATVEAGGTKILCAIADADGHFLEQIRISTGSPTETIRQIADFYRSLPVAYENIRATGIASFGPLNLDRNSADYGQLTTTPKPGWSLVNLRREMENILPCPAEIDTDVNCAGLAEGMFGAAQGLDRFCYITVGTGIGVGIIDKGNPLSGVGHPEVGHMQLPRAPGDDFAGICPYHGDCAEGLACGPAMKARWNQSAEDIPEDHVGWAFEAHYIAAICVNLTYTLRPQKIVIGGGVMERSSLYAPVREAFSTLMAGYSPDQYSTDIEQFLSAPALHTPSPGLMGAFELARRAVKVVPVFSDE